MTAASETVLEAEREPVSIQPWVRGRFLLEVIVTRRISPLGALIIAFTIYWLIPLSFSFVDGTLITAKAADQLKQHWLPLHSHLAVIDSEFDILIAHQHLRTLDALAYLNDRTHFLFATIISLGVGVSVVLVRRFEVVVKTLLSQDILVGRRTEIIERYELYRSRAYGIPGILFAALMSGLTLIVFSALTYSSEAYKWWGYSVYGHAGLAFSVLVSFTIFWGSRGFSSSDMVRP